MSIFYHETDIKFPNGTFVFRVSPNTKKPKQNEIHEIAGVMQLKYVDGLFGQAILTCLLLHLANPKTALLEIQRVTKSTGGVIVILIPCEPGPLLKLSIKFLTARKLGNLDFSAMNSSMLETT